MKKLLNLEYGGVFASYWIYYGVVASFNSAFLLARGYSNSEIGVILAVASIISVFLQPILGDISDRSKRLDVISVSKLSVVALMIIGAGLFVFKDRSPALWLVYVLISAGVLALQPLFNSLCFKLEESGYHINFGVCRACGSLGYAIFVIFMGMLVEGVGVGTLPIAGEISLLSLLLMLIFTRRTFTKSLESPGSEVSAVTKEEVAENINLLDFMRRNKLFVALNAGVILLFFHNYISNNYMLQIVEGVGGDAADMGRIFSVMAFLEMPALFFFDKIRSRFKLETLLIFSAFCFVAKFAMFYIASSVWMLYAAHFFQIFSFPIFLSSMVAYTNAIMSKGEAVKGQSLYTACTTVSSVFASILGGIMLDMSGPKFLIGVSTITALFGAIVVTVIVNKLKKIRTAD